MGEPRPLYRGGVSTESQPGPKTRFNGLGTPSPEERSRPDGPRVPILGQVFPRRTHQGTSTNPLHEATMQFLVADVTGTKPHPEQYPTADELSAAAREGATTANRFLNFPQLQARLGALLTPKEEPTTLDQMFYIGAQLVLYVAKYGVPPEMCEEIVSRLVNEPDRIRDAYAAVSPQET